MANQDPESDPRHHTAKVGRKLEELIAHLREDVGKIEEPKAQALFETGAEVFRGCGPRSSIMSAGRNLRCGSSNLRAMNWLKKNMHTSAPAATILVRLLVGGVFSPKGFKSFFIQAN